MNDDVISRQEAIDVLKVGEELLSRVLEDTEVVGNVRDKYEWGLELLKSCISDIEALQPAQAEILKCKDCKHSGEKPIADGRYWCELDGAFRYYCSDAERRANGSDR